MIANYLNKPGNTLSLIGPLHKGEIPQEGKILFIDGGAQFKKEEGFSLGDNDSYKGTLDLLLPQTKSFSDLAFALSQIPEQYQTISLLGFLGGRKDHELINLGEVSHFLKNRNKTQVFWENKIISISEGTWQFELKQVFSLFSFTENRVDLSGECKYPLSQGYLKPYSSHGLSNEAQGKIRIINENPLHLFLSL